MRRKGNILVLALGGVALIAIALAGYFYLQNQQLIKNTPLTYEECLKVPGAISDLSYPSTCRTPDGRTARQVLTPEEQKKVQPPDETVNWKTYTDNKYYFSLKYPPEWKIKGETNPETGQYTIVFQRTPIVPDSLTIILVKENWSVDQEVNSHNQKQSVGPSSEILKIEDTKVGGLEAKKFTYSTAMGTTPEETTTSKGTTVYSFISFPNDTVFDQILSTFKFTDSGVSQVSCQTDSDCQAGEKCLTYGPMVKDAPINMYCTPPGVSVPF